MTLGQVVSNQEPFPLLTSLERLDWAGAKPVRICVLMELGAEIGRKEVVRDI